MNELEFKNVKSYIKTFFVDKKSILPTFIIAKPKYPEITQDRLRSCILNMIANGELNYSLYHELSKGEYYDCI